MSGRAIVRADAGPAEGSGHVSRCIALAQALQAQDWAVTLVTRTGVADYVPGIVKSGIEIAEFDDAALRDIAGMSDRLGAEADAAIFDGYGFTAEDEAAARRWASVIVAIDDQPNRKHDCDLLLDQTLGRRPEDYADCVRPEALILTGTEFVLLNSAFMEARRRRKLSQGKQPALVLSFGGADEHDLASRALEELAECGWQGSVTVVLPRSAPHFAGVSARATGLPFPVRLADNAGPEDMAEILAQADIAAGTAGVSTWERCMLGIPSVVVVVADNQARIAQAVNEAGAAMLLGTVEALEPGALAAGIQALASDPALRERMSAACTAVCDGQGAARVADAIEARIGR